MEGIGSEEMLSRKSSCKKNKTDSDNARKLKERIEEYKLWNDDKAFLQMEYDERRSRKKAEKGIIRSDKKLRRSKICYIPALFILIFGVILFLISTIDGFALDTIMWEHKIYAQSVGVVLIALGIIMLMVVGFYTYKREDAVRHKYGFPSMYEASNLHQPSLKAMDQSRTFSSDFVERSSSKGRMSRMTSVESKASISNLGCSFSSNSTTMSWLHKHKKEHSISTNKTLRRDNSDSALDTFFARNRIPPWQAMTSGIRTNTEQSEREDGGEGPDRNNDKPDSQANLSVATASSGYHSNIPSPTHQNASQKFTYSPTFIRSISEQCDTMPSPEYYDDCGENPVKHNNIINHPLQSSIPLTPIITIEISEPYRDNGFY